MKKETAEKKKSVGNDFPVDVLPDKLRRIIN